MYTSVTNSPKRQSLFSCRFAFSSLTIALIASLACDFVISLTKPRTLLLRAPPTHHMPTQRPRCFLIPPVWYRLRIEFSYARFAAPRNGDAFTLSFATGIRLSLVACSLRSIQARRASRRTSLRRPRETEGIGGQPRTRPETMLQICALEQ